MIVENKYVKQTLTELTKLIVGGLTFVSALAWNEAFKDYFANNAYLKGKGLWFYAIFTSLIAVMIIIGINSLSKYAFALAIITLFSFFYIILPETNILNTSSTQKITGIDTTHSSLQNMSASISFK